MDTQTIDQEYEKLQGEFADVAKTVQGLAEKLQAAQKAGDGNAGEWLADLKQIAQDVSVEETRATVLLQAIHGFISNIAQAQAEAPAATRIATATATGTGTTIQATTATMTAAFRSITSTTTFCRSATTGKSSTCRSWPTYRSSSPAITGWSRSRSTRRRVREPRVICEPAAPAAVTPSLN